MGKPEPKPPAGPSAADQAVLDELRRWGGPAEMSAFEAIMWRAEIEPQLRSTTTSVFYLDREPEWPRFRAEHAWLAEATPRFRQRVIVPALGAGQPHWVDDPDFNLDWHVRHTRLPAPGSERQLLDLAAQIAMAPFDRARPPWEAVLVEGLEGGRAGYILKLHHSTSDGMGIMQLLSRFFSNTRETPPRPQPPARDTWASRPPGVGELTRKALRGKLLALPKQAAGLIDGARRSAAALATDPDEARKTRDYLTSAKRMLGTKPASGSGLLRRRGLNWRFDTIEIPLTEMKAAAKAAEGSLNDVLLSGLMGGFRRYHEELGVPIQTMPIGFPISLRTDNDPMGGNKFAGSQYPAPVGEKDPVARVRDVQRFVKQMKAEPALDLMIRLMPVVTRLPMKAITSMIGDFVRAQDAQISNVPGVQHAVYLAGAEITHLWPYAPAAGCGMMITMISHNGRCCIGINSDRAAVTEPELLVQCLREGLDELLELGRTAKTKTRS